MQISFCSEHISIELEDEEVYTRLENENMKLKDRLAIWSKVIVAEENAATIAVVAKYVPAVVPTAVGAMRAEQTPSPGHSHSLPTPAIISHVNATSAKFDNYQCNSILSWAKALQTAGTNKSPRDIANEINKHDIQSPPVVMLMQKFITIFLYPM
ncbi:PREDICTED: probable arginine--tRNA ligase, cytoplasmic isoform X1 [Rhagoletis zephyria]|uniref:probable arginine--tRNA ligase, cytoplasmic isoform X1 n=1 Tax=Rhagoletis zephyria TaxID=28612 RepID=UPI00081159F6|nr:PREDICTED: probable arginine--tRNA ligase, cytoplasmic isoform X1 [Rhagoletis zephyria]